MENKNPKKVLLSVRNLKKFFPVKKTKLFQKEQYYVHANENISLDIYQGETLGLVGESGCGKSTFGRTLIQLYEQTAGSTLYYGETIAEMAPAYVRTVIRNIPKEFEAYKAAEKKLEEDRAKVQSLEGLEKAALEESIMHQNRHIEERYVNMARIAGGLLVSKDLQTVSKKLLTLHEVRVKIAKEKRKIVDLITKKTDQKARRSSQALETIDKEIRAIEDSIVDLEQKAAVHSEEVEALRDSLRQERDFERYESQRDDGVDLSNLNEEEMRNLRKDLQIIFQDPYSSLDPRMTIGQIISEGVVGHGIFKNSKSEGYNEYIQEVMEQCGLAPYFIHRYPHQFSGGQRQRIGIARALALKPKFIVCDEAVSALDVSIQSQVINLLQDLKDEHNLTYLFITHDLSVVKYISDRIGVMYLGKIVELAESEKIFERPLHPYTQALLAAIPRTDVEHTQELSILEGDIPSAVHPPTGCRFHTRCKYATERCVSFEPELKEVEEGHFVACHLMDMTETEIAEALETSFNRHLGEN